MVTHFILTPPSPQPIPIPSSTFLIFSPFPSLLPPAFPSPSPLLILLHPRLTISNLTLPTLLVHSHTISSLQPLNPFHLLPSKMSIILIISFLHHSQPFLLFYHCQLFSSSSLLTILPLPILLSTTFTPHLSSPHHYHLPPPPPKSPFLFTPQLRILTTETSNYFTAPKPFTESYF